MKIKTMIVDLVSCFAFFTLLGVIGAPWWMYVAALAFGTVRCWVGRKQMRAELEAA